MTVAKTQISPDVLIVDCDHMAHRAFHVFGQLCTSDGTMSGVVYGVLSMLKTQLEKVGPKQMILTWGGTGAGMKRKEMSPSYKATRVKHPNFRSQLGDIQWFLSYMDWEQYMNNTGWEADDVIATLAIFYANQGKTVSILSGDHDFHQLVSDRISCIVPGTRQKPDTVYTPEKVVETYGVTPDLLPDVFALCGETGDNIQGVPSVGEKTAQNIIRACGAIETWTTNIGALNVTAKIKETLQANIELIQLNRQLVNLRDKQVELVEIEREYDIKQAQDILDKYEIKKFSASAFLPF